MWSIGIVEIKYLSHTVNPEIFARILFSRKGLNNIFATLKIATRAWFNYISIGESNFAIFRGFHFHETSQMRSFAKIKPSRKFPNLQYLLSMVFLSMYRDIQGMIINCTAPCTSGYKRMKIWPSLSKIIFLQGNALLCLSRVCLISIVALSLPYKGVSVVSDDAGVFVLLLYFYAK